MDEQVRVRVQINGRPYSAEVPARMLLVDFIRETCGLTGTHIGCEHGVCGACAVLLDGQSVRSCLLLAVQADGSEIVTVEGLGPHGQLSPLQEAFWDHHALQCGFCTPGFLISSHELLHNQPDPTDEQILDTLSGHICRCTGYEPIVAAVKDAAGRCARGRTGRGDGKRGEKQ